jgi:hypothetical protein
VVEHAHRTRLEQQVGTEPGVLAQVGGGQDAQQVPVRHEGHVAALQRLGHPGQHPRRSGGDLLDRLARGVAGHDPVAEHRPARVAQALADLGRRPPLVAAVVPLHEVVVGDRVEPGELGRAPGPRQG